MRISVDTDRCICAGHCVLEAPLVFDQSEDDGTVILLNPEPPVDQHQAVRTAEVFCPGRVIEIVES